jgi:hypothetical protein
MLSKQQIWPALQSFAPSHASCVFARTQIHGGACSASERIGSVVVTGLDPFWRERSRLPTLTQPALLASASVAMRKPHPRTPPPWPALQPANAESARSEVTESAWSWRTLS